VTDLGGRVSLAELAAVLARAAAVVVGNTGPAHLAAAVGTPVVSIFPPTVAATGWRPYGTAIVLGDQEVPCAGCRARRCPVPGHPCVGRLSVAEVVAAVEALAEGRSGRPARWRVLAGPTGRPVEAAR
jgi:ADP-heptose:LPS heptosyltransferase